jgi:uncharacterized protein (DUF2267 family)
MSHDELIEEVAAHAGVSRTEGARAIAALLATLAERLSAAESAALADALPDTLAAPLHSGCYEGTFDRDELIARVARREGVGLTFALEHAQSVGRVLAEALPPSLLERLRRALPPDIAALLAPPPVEAEPPPRTPYGHTLADGRPGSRHPLSEAARERAHSQSVARADNPHADTKLSTSRGLTQERERESLATGRPGSTDPLDEYSPTRRR